MPRGAWMLTRTLAWLLFALAIAAALWGSRDPLMNLAPTLVWICAWVGLSFASALLGNIWPLLDPWRTSFDTLDACVRKFGRPGGLALGWPWPLWLGVWPALPLLLLWCWLEVVHPLAGTPFKLGIAILLWSAFNFAGMVCFGRERWQDHADMFAVYFALLARLAPLRLVVDDHGPARPAPGQTAFVLAMLSTVIFDGLHGGAAWNLFEAALRKLAPQWMDINGYFVGTTALVTVWLVFLGAYLATRGLSLALMRPAVSPTAAAALAARLALTLLPIALAYNVAHNFSTLVTQGQTVVQLLSDPFGRQWDLFGSARAYPDIGIVDARLTWFVAVAAIVLGHAASIGWSHRVALAAGVSPRRTALALLPLTVLMVAYTAVSLTLIAEPMVSAPAP